MEDVSAEPTMATEDEDSVAGVPDMSLVADVSDIGFIAYTQGMIELQVAISQDGSTYGDWATFVAGEYEGRAFKFRLVLRSLAATHVPFITALSVVCDMPDRLESANSVTVEEDATTHIAFSIPFKAPPNVQVTPLDFEANETFTLTNITASGFDFVMDSHGHEAHTINWLARGYGKVIE
jgi:hypothetical protein